MKHVKIQETTCDGCNEWTDTAEERKELDHWHPRRRNCLRCANNVVTLLHVGVEIWKHNDRLRRWYNEARRQGDPPR